MVDSTSNNHCFCLSTVSFAGSRSTLVIPPKHRSFWEQEFNREEIKIGKYSPMEVLEKKKKKNSTTDDILAFLI